MKKIVLLLSLILGSVLYSYNKINDTVHTNNIFIKDEPIQKSTIKESFKIKNFIIKPLYDYEIKGIVLDSRLLRSDKKEHSISNIDIVLGWKELSKPENFNNINLNLNYRWFSWENNSKVENKIIQKSLSNNHIIYSDSMIKKQLLTLKKNDAVLMKGSLVRVIDERDNNWAWRSSTSRNDIGDGSSEVFYVNHIELIK